MGLFNSKSSWSSQGKASGGMFHPEKRCPPVEDCNVKNFVVAGKRVTARGKKEIAAVAAQQKKARQQEAADKKKAKKEAAEAKRRGTWPNAGKYDPNKSRGRGK